MGIFLGTIHYWFLVFYVSFLGCCRNGSGVRPYLWIQEKIVSLESAPTMRDTQPSISSETCMMCSSVNPGKEVFCDWLFLGYSCVSIETTVHFRLFLSVMKSWGRKQYSTVVRTALMVILKIKLGKNGNMKWKLTSHNLYSQLIIKS